MSGKKLKEAIKNAGYTQEEFAKLIHTNRSLISQWINGKKPSVTSVKKISKALKIPFDYFVEKPKNKINGLDKKDIKILELEKQVLMLENKVLKLEKENTELKNTKA